VPTYLPLFLLLTCPLFALAGTVPPGLGALPSLLYLDLSSNKLTGGLAPFAAALAAADPPLLYLNMYWGTGAGRGRGGSLLRCLD
jgi:hypothetical protein